MSSLPVLNSGPDAPAGRATIAADLSRLLKGQVRFDAHHQLLYATDASLYQVRPIGVVFPQDADDVCAALNYCNANRVALLPRGRSSRRDVSVRPLGPTKAFLRGFAVWRKGRDRWPPLRAVLEQVTGAG